MGGVKRVPGAHEPLRNNECEPRSQGMRLNECVRESIQRFSARVKLQVEVQSAMTTDASVYMCCISNCIYGHGCPHFNL